MKKGFYVGLFLECVYGFLLTTVCFVFAEPIMMLFTNEKIVIIHGITYLRLISIIYVVPGITNALQGYFRGIGKLQITLFSSFSYQRIIDNQNYERKEKCIWMKENVNDV